jgi:hypothetical protein
MEGHHRQHQTYPREWHQLDFTFSLPGSYRRDDPDARAKASDGATWRPRGCKLTYVIKEATATTLLIQGVNDSGEVEYEIEQWMEDPRRVGAPSPSEPAGDRGGCR